MDQAKFWNLVDQSRTAADGDPEEQLEHLREQLLALEPDEIVAFDKRLSEHHMQAYDWGLWGAAYLIGGGCSDDGFADFRGWLISRGKQAYDAALADPDSLAKIVKEHDGECQVEGYQYVASQAWEEKTGRDSDEFPRHDIPARREPAGESWEEDELEARFPKLAKKFG